MTAAWAGAGDVLGVDKAGAAAALAAFERFKYEYGPADQLREGRRCTPLEKELQDEAGGPRISAT